jgi:tRNA threonylcarbamoyladenosine biosynthesis protein TsaB
MAESTGETDFRLAVETSGRLGSLALGRGDRIIESARFAAERRHAVELLPTVGAVCERNHVRATDICAVYVSGGPGSFTGLRIGIMFAKAVALTGGASVVRVPTLDVIAQNALSLAAPPSLLAVVLDAKRGHVYAAVFQHDRAAARYGRLSAPVEVDPAEFLAARSAGTAVVGEGVLYHADAVRRSGCRILPAHLNDADAENVYKLGHELAAGGAYSDPATLTPIYIRRPEAEEVYERRHGGPTGR